MHKSNEIKFIQLSNKEIYTKDEIIEFLDYLTLDSAEKGMVEELKGINYVKSIVLKLKEVQSKIGGK